jgi:hypothetical protein
MDMLVVTTLLGVGAATAVAMWWVGRAMARRSSTGPAGRFSPARTEVAVATAPTMRLHGVGPSLVPARRAQWARTVLVEPAPRAPRPESADAQAEQAAGDAPATSPATLHVTLAFGKDTVTAGFSGMRPLPNAPAVDSPFRWSKSPNRVPAQATAPVCLGVGARGCLFVDLALSPGLITVSGDPRVREEIGAELVRRLRTAARVGDRRFDVVIAGTPFNPEYVQADTLRAPSVGALDLEALPVEAEICFVVCRLAEPADAARILSLAAAPGRRIIPIVVDDVVGSDWSLFAPTRDEHGAVE